MQFRNGCEHFRLFSFLYCRWSSCPHKRTALLTSFGQPSLQYSFFSVYGMMQLYPLLLDYFQKSKPLVIDLTICSSLSNKNFFAEVITILLPFQFYGVRKEKGTWLVLSWTSLSLCIFWIILLQTVSSWLAILIGCLLMLVLARITRTNSVVEKKGISVRSIFLRFGLVCIVLGTVFFFIQNQETSLIWRKRWRW